MAEKFAEIDLYEPIYNYLVKLGYTVRSEVKDCDMVALKENELIIIELKKSFNLKLVYQAIERQKRTDFVYVAIPRPIKGQKSREWKSVLDLLKRLDLGLITVALDSKVKTVDVILTPNMGYKRRNLKKEKVLMGELAGRSGEFNKGGANKKKIATAFREHVIEIACLLEFKDQITLKEMRELGFGTKESVILSRNMYQWFDRVGKGIYALNNKGRQELDDDNFKELVVYYREKAKDKLKG